MAAGQHRVSRRQVFDLYSRKENLHHRNAVVTDVERKSRDEAVERKSFSKSRTLGSEVDAFVGRTKREVDAFVGRTNREVDAFVGRTKREDRPGFSSSNGYRDAPVSVLGPKGRETSGPKDRDELPPQKKRKFSPILWDGKEKEVRVSSKNRVVRTVALPSPPRPCTRVSGGSSGGPDSEHLSSPTNVAHGMEDDVSDQVPESGFHAISSPLPSEHILNDDQNGVHMEKDDFLPARSISLSRWASDSDSPRDGHVPQRGEVGHHTSSNSAVDSEMSSPESGEFLIEDSGRVSRGSSVSSDGYFIWPASKDCLAKESSDDFSMAVDVKSSDNGAANQLDSDSEDDVDSQQVEEPKISTGRDINMLQGCRDVSEYERLNRISEGTYGVVYRARDKKTGEIVALKKVKMGIERDGGFPLSALREMNILLSFRHPAVVDVKEVVMGDLDSIFMVMEYMEHDLQGVMEKMKHPFSTSEVKCLMLQLLEGVKYLHDNWVLHRDLKTSNLLLNNRGELKVCDLGLSRQYGSPLKPYTPLVVTLWYRAPELLLGAKQYSTAIDMWSVGCIMAEFLAKKPLFAGETEVSQLDKIFGVLGMPSESNWPGFSELPGPGVRVNFKGKLPYSLLRRKFPATSFTGSPALSESGFDLLSKLLTYDPAKRMSVDEALDHEWFREVPLPKSKDFMPTFPPSMPKL